MLRRWFFKKVSCTCTVKLFSSYTLCNIDREHFFKIPHRLKYTQIQWHFRNPNFTLMASVAPVWFADQLCSAIAHGWARAKLMGSALISARNQNELLHLSYQSSAPLITKLCLVLSQTWDESNEILSNRYPYFLEKKKKNDEKSKRHRNTCVDEYRIIVSDIIWKYVKIPLHEFWVWLCNM